MCLPPMEHRLRVVGSKGTTQLSKKLHEAGGNGQDVIGIFRTTIGQ